MHPSKKYRRLVKFIHVCRRTSWTIKESNTGSILLELIEMLPKISMGSDILHRSLSRAPSFRRSGIGGIYSRPYFLWYFSLRLIWYLPSILDIWFILSILNLHVITHRLIVINHWFLKLVYNPLIPNIRHSFTNHSHRLRSHYESSAIWVSTRLCSHYESSKHLSKHASM